MTPQDEQMIRQSPIFRADSLPRIILVPDNGAAGQRMVRFCDRIKDLVPNLKIKKDSDSPYPRPALVVGHHQNIGYQAEPTGKILPYFLDALAGASGAEAEIDAELSDQIKKIERNNTTFTACHS